MAGETATYSRSRTRLGNAMGVPSPTGWCQLSRTSPVAMINVAWQEVYSSPSPGAQPIVCLHDAASGSREFLPLTKRIPANSRLILVDWPGHGRSDDPPNSDRNAYPHSASKDSTSSQFTLDQCTLDLQSILEQLDLAASMARSTVSNRPILLASGFSAAVAIQYAARHPGHVLGLVLIEPGGLISPTRSGTAQTPSKCDSTIRLTSVQRQAFRMEILAARMAKVKASAEVSLQQSQAGLRASLGELACHTLFALSRDSELFSLKKYLGLLEPLVSHAPQHTFTVFSGGFNPAWDEPDRFAQAVNGFVQAQLPLAHHHHAWLLTAVDWPARGSNLWKCVHPDCNEEKIAASDQQAN